MATGYFIMRFLRKRRLKKERQIYNNLVSSPVSCHDGDNSLCKVEYKCRLCMKDANIPIFGQGNSFDISEAIRTFGAIELSEEDDFPKHLCPTCFTFLESAVLFRKSVQDTDKLFRSRIFKENEDFEYNDAVDNEYSCESTPKTQYCKICKQHFQSFSEFTQHKKSRIHKNVRIQCLVCFRLLTVQLYKKHLARHQSPSHLVCEICGKLYRKDNLGRHLQLHTYELPFQCKLCPYRGRFTESLKIHMRTHTGDKPFSCDKCELRFLTRSNLNRHLLTHKKEKPFICSECGRGFYTKSDMDAHFKADHAGLKDFTCRMCGNKYGTRKALMRHELRVHKRDKMAKGRAPLYLQADYQRHGNVTN